MCLVPAAARVLGGRSCIKNILGLMLSLANEQDMDFNFHLLHVEFWVGRLEVPSIFVTV